jgi:hypothetical protein
MYQNGSINNNKNEMKKSSFMLFPAVGRVYIWKTPKEAHNLEWWFPTVTCGEVL